MNEIVFETVNAKKSGVGFSVIGYRDIIQRYLAYGYEYKGFVPKEISGYGVPVQIDLIFVKTQ